MIENHDIAVSQGIFFKVFGQFEQFLDTQWHTGFKVKSTIFVKNKNEDVMKIDLVKRKIFFLNERTDSFLESY